MQPTSSFRGGWARLSSLKFSRKENPKLYAFLTCYVAMESWKVIMCVGMKLYKLVVLNNTSQQVW